MAHLRLRGIRNKLFLWCIYREMTAPLNYRARGKALTREIAKKQDFTLVHGELAILAAEQWWS